MGLVEVVEAPLDELRITVVYDNTAFQQDLEADWGFSCLIEGLERTILFDTGASGTILLNNMDRLGIDPGDVQTVLLSHEHWDHVDGLDGFLERNADVDVLLLGSFPFKLSSTISAFGGRTVVVDGPLEIVPGAYSTGPMRGEMEEQSLLLATDRGTIVITGCAHPGIAETVRRAAELTGQEILLVMGGFHLRSCSESDVMEIIGEFRRLGVRFAGPCHCTGEEQIRVFEREYGSNFVSIGAGRRIDMEDLL